MRPGEGPRRDVRQRGRGEMGSYDAKRRGLHPLGTHLLVVIFAAAFLFAGTAAVVIAGPAGPASAQAEGTYGCPPGSFFDGDGCYLVPIGSYQPYQGWDEAFACPLPTSTASTGATDSAQCNVLPGPGQYASDQVFYAITQPFDVVVFQLCAPGTYQPFEGQTSCYAAPPGSYIDVSGATEIERGASVSRGDVLDWWCGGLRGRPARDGAGQLQRGLGSDRRCQLQPWHHVTGRTVFLRSGPSWLIRAVLWGGQPLHLCRRNLPARIRRNGLHSRGRGPLCTG